MEVGARQSHLSHPQQSPEIAQHSAEKQKHPVSGTAVGRKALLMRDVQTCQENTVTTLSKCGEQKSISDSTTRKTLRQMGYKIRRPQRVPLLPAKSRNLSLQLVMSSQDR